MWSLFRTTRVHIITHVNISSRKQARSFVSTFKMAIFLAAATDMLPNCVTSGCVIVVVTIFVAAIVWLFSSAVIIVLFLLRCCVSLLLLKLCMGTKPTNICGLCRRCFLFQSPQTLSLLLQQCRSITDVRVRRRKRTLPSMCLVQKL
ncbi:hypothetical protein RND81_02G078200 [Saponaria officinalis]|uniref:Uncharacterized protein n=1 Tax=Saponaria officinalis TaxID=3572 RepID=A0AAW1MRL9_SAPOF